MLINRELQLAPNLVYKNNPSTIVILDSRNRSINIETMDRIHKGLGMKMFGYHYMIYRDGTIHAGRPERAFSADVAVLQQVMQTNLVNANVSPFSDNLDLEVESAANVFSSGRIFICLEGYTSVQDITTPQRSSLVDLCRNIKERNRNLRGIYSLAELIPTYDNLGVYVDMNQIRAEVNNTLVPTYVATPAGSVSYTYGGRDLSYNPEAPLSGNDVKLVQLYLKALSIPIKDLSGEYNMFTHKAVKTFQRMFKLPITGSMTGKTYDLLRDKVRELSIVIDYSQYHRLLRYIPSNEMQGKDVDRLQGNLARLYLAEQTGRFDKQTEDAVKEFQRTSGLTQDGEVGPITWRMLVEKPGVDYTRALRYNPNNPMSGPDVKFIQERIKRVARKFGISHFLVSGTYDEVTEGNIKKIQSQINHPITGIVDEKMFTYLAN